MRATRIAIFRDEAVSPVIAVLLLLAITVVLAAAVYVTVSSIAEQTGKGNVYIGISRYKIGNNFSITIEEILPTVPTRDVYIVITSTNNSILLQSTPLSQLPEFHDLTLPGTLNAGDYLWLSAETYPSGSRVMFFNEQQLILSFVLPG